MRHGSSVLCMRIGLACSSGLAAFRRHEEHHMVVVAKTLLSKSMDCWVEPNRRWQEHSLGANLVTIIRVDERGGAQVDRPSRD